MSFPSRERSSSLFIISEGQFYSKPSLKLERLEKDYSDLKRKENEDGIELRRLRTENLLLKQRIANLEKESATLAHKLVQDKVVWAQEVEQLYAVRTRLSLTLRQLRETQNQLHDAENTIDELSKKNRISTDQIRRVGEHNKELRELLEEITQDKNVLHTQMNMLARKLDDAESTRQTEAIIARIKDAEGRQQLAELRRQLAEIDIQVKVEKLAIGQIRDQANCYPLVTSLCDLQDQQLLEYQLNVPDVCVHREHQGMTDSQQWAINSEAPTVGQWAISSDDEFDALIKDSESLERTLSDIIEGRHNSSKTMKRDAKEGILSDSRDLRLESNIPDTVNYVPISHWHQTNMAEQLESGSCDSRQYTGGTVADLANVNDISGDEFTGSVDVNDISDGKAVAIANVGVITIDDINNENIVSVTTIDDINDENIVGVTIIDEINDKKKFRVSNADIAYDKMVDVAKDAVTNEKMVGVAREDISKEKSICLSNDQIIDKTLVGRENDHDIRDEKVIVAVNVFPVDAAQSESRFKRLGEFLHDDDVYQSPGGAVVHLFGYKGEATLLLKESAV